MSVAVRAQVLPAERQTVENKRGIVVPPAVAIITSSPARNRSDARGSESGRQVSRSTTSATSATAGSSTGTDSFHNDIIRYQVFSEPVVLPVLLVDGNALYDVFYVTATIVLVLVISVVKVMGSGPPMSSSGQIKERPKHE